MTKDVIIALIEQIDEFTIKCGEHQHTDTGEAHELLERLRERLNQALGEA